MTKQHPCFIVHNVNSTNERFIDLLRPKARKMLREWSARGGRNGRGEAKARASRIGWAHSPNRFAERRERRLAALPQGFMCECGKWHSYPNYMEAPCIHTCSCEREHNITRQRVAVLRKPRKKISKTHG